MSILSRTIYSGLLLCMATSTAQSQDFRWPEEPENLQVLPEGTKGAELGQIMG